MPGGNLRHERGQPLSENILLTLGCAYWTECVGQGPYAPQGSTSLLPKLSVTSKVSAPTSYAWVESRVHFRSSEDVILLEFTNLFRRSTVSPGADVGSFIESKTSVVQTSNVGFTSEVPDYLVVHTGPDHVSKSQQPVCSECDEGSGVYVGLIPWSLAGCPSLCSFRCCCFLFLVAFCWLFRFY